MGMATTTIQVSTNVREKLKKLGHKGDTYDTIIINLINEHEYNQFMEQQYNILENEENWTPLENLE